MKLNYTIGILLVFMLQTLNAQNTVKIGKTMYQNQAFTAKDKQIFDSDWEGLRVWRWSKAQAYCRKLKLDGYDGWRVASRKELQSLLTKKPSANGLYVKSKFVSKMPATGGKYDDVWMWTRDAKSSKLGGFVNFKKAKSGWADKKYKGYVLCTRERNTVCNAKCKAPARQELSCSNKWVKAWDTCSGYVALQKNGSLWQFGKVGSCGWGGIVPINPKTGKALYEKKQTYHLKPRQIGKGFQGAKFINGRYRIYAIKRDGTLWGWGEGFGATPKKLNSSRNWSDFGVKYEGNGCCGYDVGLKEDGTLWRIPETTFSEGKYKTAFKLQKIGQFSDWKKIVLGCCNIYGLRKNGTLWKSSDIDDKGLFKKFTAKKKTYDGDTELYSYLKSKMVKVRAGKIYVYNFIKTIKANRDGTLCLLPKK